MSLLSTLFGGLGRAQATVGAQSERLVPIEGTPPKRQLQEDSIPVTPDTLERKALAQRLTQSLAARQTDASATPVSGASSPAMNGTGQGQLAKTKRHEERVRHLEAMDKNKKVSSLRPRSTLLWMQQTNAGDSAPLDNSAASPCGRGVDMSTSSGRAAAASSASSRAALTNGHSSSSSTLAVMKMTGGRRSDSINGATRNANVASNSRETVPSGRVSDKSALPAVTATWPRRKIQDREAFAEYEELITREEKLIEQLSQHDESLRLAREKLERQKRQELQAAEEQLERVRAKIGTTASRAFLASEDSVRTEGDHGEGAAWISALTVAIQGVFAESRTLEPDTSGSLMGTPLSPRAAHSKQQASPERSPDHAGKAAVAPSLASHPHAFAPPPPSPLPPPSSSPLPSRRSRAAVRSAAAMHTPPSAHPPRTPTSHEGPQLASESEALYLTERKQRPLHNDYHEQLSRQGQGQQSRPQSQSLRSPPPPKHASMQQQWQQPPPSPPPPSSPLAPPQQHQRQAKQGNMRRNHDMLDAPALVETPSRQDSRRTKSARKAMPPEHSPMRTHRELQNALSEVQSQPFKLPPSSPQTTSPTSYSCATTRSTGTPSSRLAHARSSSPGSHRHQPLISQERVTDSPTGRMSGTLERRKDIRGADMVSNIDFVVGKAGSIGNTCTVKEASWVPSQAWFESLRYYPSSDEALVNDDTPGTFSGNTHGLVIPEHLETDVRTRLGIGTADPHWTDSQLQLVWAPPASEVTPVFRAMHEARHPRPRSPVPAQSVDVIAC